MPRSDGAHSDKGHTTNSAASETWGPVEAATLCGDRATAPIENIWFEKIRGCSCRCIPSFSRVDAHMNGFIQSPHQRAPLGLPVFRDQAFSPPSH
jgi:hypothetical protein